MNANYIPPNLLSRLTSNTVLYSTLFLISFLVLMLFLVLFDVKFMMTKSKEAIVQNTLIMSFSALLLFGFCVAFVPYFKDIKEFIIQIQNVMFIILYTISMILFYTLVPKPFLEKYSYVIHPAVLSLGLVAFYMSSSTNILSGFNMNYERIKMMILFLCLIAIVVTFYNQKLPGDNFVSVILGVAAIFAFVYTVILIAMPTGASNTDGLSVSWFGISGTIAFLAFLGVLGWLVYSQRTSILENKAKLASIVVFTLVISILWATLIGAHIFSVPTNLNMSWFNSIQAALKVVFGIVISGLIIYWISSSLENLSGKSSIVSFSLNIALVAVVLALIYRTMTVTLPYENAKKNAFFNLIYSIILYIPCLISSLFDAPKMGDMGMGKGLNMNMGKGMDTGSVMMLILSIALLVMYYYSHVFLTKISASGGKQLVSKPIPLSRQTVIGNYLSLNGRNGTEEDGLNYQYAISFWIFIESAPPNTNANYNKFTPLFNYGNKPAVLYHASKNTLRIIMQQQDLKTTTSNKLMEFDDNENRIIYENKEWQLQKWNNIIMNYNGGTLDIFLNGQLVKSSIEVSPYFTYDNMVVGLDGGILGGICNVLYFNKSIDTSKIYYLYNMVKDVSPPVLDYKDPLPEVNNIQNNI